MIGPCAPPAAGTVIGLGEAAMAVHSRSGLRDRHRLGGDSDSGIARAAPLLAAAVTVTEPLPLPLAGTTVANAAPDDAVHESGVQPAGVTDTVTVASPANAKSNDMEQSRTHGKSSGLVVALLQQQERGSAAPPPASAGYSSACCRRLEVLSGAGAAPASARVSGVRLS